MRNTSSPACCRSLTSVFQLHFQSQITTIKCDSDPSTVTKAPSFSSVKRWYRAKKIISFNISHQGSSRWKYKLLNSIFNCARLKHHYLYIPLLPWLYSGNPTDFGSEAAELFWMQAWKSRNDCWDQKAWCFCHKEYTMMNVEGPL